MSKAKTKMDPFALLIAEGKKAKAEKAKAKWTPSKSSKNRNEARLSNVMRLTRTIDDERIAIISQNLRRSHIHATIKHERCRGCQGKTSHIAVMYVVLADAAGNNHQLADRISSRGMYEYHYDLPIRYREVEEFVPVCPSCLIRDADVRDEEIKRGNASYRQRQAFAWAHRTRPLDASVPRSGSSIHSTEQVLEDLPDPSEWAVEGS